MLFSVSDLQLEGQHTAGVTVTDVCKETGTYDVEYFEY